MTELTVSTRVRATPDQVSSELGREVVILHVKNGQYYGLDEVGALIWKRLREGSSVAEIVAAITAEFDVDTQACELDVLQLLSEMVEAQLITIES